LDTSESGDTPTRQTTTDGTDYAPTSVDAFELFKDLRLTRTGVLLVAQPLIEQRATSVLVTHTSVFVFVQSTGLPVLLLLKLLLVQELMLLLPLVVVRAMVV